MLIEEVLYWVFFICALVLLCICAYQDYKTQDIADIWLAGFVILCGFCGTMKGDKWSVLLGFSLTLLFLSLPDLPFFGGADGAVYAGLLAAFGWISLPVFLLFSNLLAIIIWGINRLKKKEERGIVLLPIILCSLPFSFAVLHFFWLPTFSYLFQQQVPINIF